MRFLPNGLRARQILMIVVVVAGAFALELLGHLGERERISDLALADATLAAHCGATRAAHALAALPPGADRRASVLAALAAFTAPRTAAHGGQADRPGLSLVSADGAWTVTSGPGVVAADAAALAAGRPQRGAELAQAMRLGGGEHVVAYAPVPGAGAEALWIAAIGDLAGPLAAQRRLLLRDLVLLALLGALVTLASWHGAEVLVLRRVHAMLAATARLRAGDLSARTGVARGRGELDTLAREFDGMAAALQQQALEQQRTAESLRLSEARKSAVLEASLDGILVLDAQGLVHECNAAARSMFGCDGRQCVHHRLSDLLPGELPFDPARFNRPQEVFETEGRRLDDTRFPAEISIAPIRTPSTHGLFVATVRDLAERKRFERTLEALSFQDELTGVYNRRGFLMFASQQLKLAARNGQRIVLVSVDLDGLKAINDTFGHANGDRALVELATTLRRSFRETDVIGRLGGDEFIVLALESQNLGAEAAIERVAMRLAGRNGEGDLPWTLSASIGWLRADPAQGLDLSAMLAEADERMYTQKRRLHPGPARGPSLELRAPVTEGQWPRVQGLRRSVQPAVRPAPARDAGEPAAAARAGTAHEAEGLRRTA